MHGGSRRHGSPRHDVPIRPARSKGARMKLKIVGVVALVAVGAGAAVDHKEHVEPRRSASDVAVAR